MKFEEGNFDYSERKNIILEMLSDAIVVFTDGITRKRWIENILSDSLRIPIVDITEFGYNDSKNRCVIICENHGIIGKVACALHIAKKRERERD